MRTALLVVLTLVAIPTGFVMGRSALEASRGPVGPWGVARRLLVVAVVYAAAAVGLPSVLGDAYLLVAAALTTSMLVGRFEVLPPREPATSRGPRLSGRVRSRLFHLIWLLVSALLISISTGLVPTEAVRTASGLLLTAVVSAASVAIALLVSAAVCRTPGLEE